MPSETANLTTPGGKLDPVRARRLSIALVFSCTIIGAAAQILIKAGAQAETRESLWEVFVAMLTTPLLLAGYGLYGLSTAILIVALKYGELSILYPVIALTYVWVSILSVAIYQEALTPLKLAGLFTVVLGVAVLGRGQRS